MESGRIATAISGARAGSPSPVRRLLSRAIGGDLTAFVVPDERAARAAGLDLGAAGLRVAATPRHASVLVLVGDIPTGLADAAAVAYAQMPRPRAILAVGAAEVAGLPTPDVALRGDQQVLAAGVRDLRQRITAGAWALDPAPFSPPETGSMAMATPGSDYATHGMADGPVPSQDASHAGHMDHGAMGHASHPTSPLSPEPSPAAAPGSEPHADHEHEHGHEGDAPSQPAHLHAPPAAPAAADMPSAMDMPGHGAMDHATMDHEAMDHSAMGHSPMNHGATDHQAMHPTSGPHGGMVDHAAMGHAPPPEPVDHAAMGHGPVDDPMAGSHEAMNHGAMDHAAMNHSTTGHDTMGQAAMSDSSMDHSRTNHDTMDHAAMGHAPPAMDHGAMGHDMPGMDHAAMGHGMGSMDHSAHMMGGFMSMVAMTKDLPRSSDGLPMEWSEAPFGPLFPGLPGGLRLTLTLDGDTVAQAAIQTGALSRGLDETWPGAAATFPNRLSRLDPLAPASYRVLALRGLAAIAPPDGRGLVEAGWIGAVERERAASHLGWLADLGMQIGLAWLADRAAAWQRALVRASSTDEIARFAGDLRRFTRDVERAPLLRRRLAGIGTLASSVAARGPVARGGGVAVDARGDHPAYGALEFAPRVVQGGDALARFRVRLAEIEQSLDLLERTGPLAIEPINLPPGLTGMGMASVETPRGAASLHVEVEAGEVRVAHLDSPSSHHADLVPAVAEGLELADALVGIASLDLSPWELDR